jgi:hypothetical protein
VTGEPLARRVVVDVVDLLAAQVEEGLRVEVADAAAGIDDKRDQQRLVTARPSPRRPCAARRRASADLAVGVQVGAVLDLGGQLLLGDQGP